MSPLPVTIVLQKKDTGVMGSYDLSRNRIVFRVDSSYDSRVDELESKKTVRHEMQHFAQEFMKSALQTEHVGEPSKSVSKTKNVKQWMKKLYNARKKLPSFMKEKLDELEEQGIYKGDTHALDDIEFYTDLGDEIQELQGWLAKNRLTTEQLKWVLRYFIGVKPVDSYEDAEQYFVNIGASPFLYDSDFFDTLLRADKNRWKKAVKILYQVVK